jgi:hypothetical protein
MVVPIAEGMQKFEHCMGLSSVRKLRIVELGSVEAHNWCNTETTADSVSLYLEHLTTSRWVPVQDLLDEEQSGSLDVRHHVHLEDAESLHKSIDCLSGQLLAFKEDDLHYFEKGYVIFELKSWVSWLLIHSLKHSVKRIQEISLIYIESGSSTNFKNLKSAKQSSENIAHSHVSGLLLGAVQLYFEVFSENRNQVPNNLNIYILAELWQTQEYTSQ